MVSQSTVLLALASLFAAASASELTTVRRGGGYPASNPAGVTCYNTWETVTNDPVVQYWYVVVANAENSLKADRIWNHLNLNGCAVTENKYHVESSINGAAVTFHASEACTAARVSDALRSGSDPPQNIACAYTGKEGGDSLEGAAEGVDAALEGILAAFGDD